MCGLVTHIAKTAAGDIPDDAFSAMLKMLESRGPDDSSVFRRDRVVLGHRRLSIIDVAGGHQPIFNEAGTVACVLNGEIYNFQSLRTRLEKSGHQFRTHSDTEVVVHLYEELGEEVFSELTGMFALVIADYSRGRVLVARDRMGEKPLYYIDRPDYFSCASEMKALRPHPLFEFRINRDALGSYLRFGWIAGEQSIFEGVRRLEPAHYLTIEHGRIEKRCYWKPDLSPLEDVSRAELCDLVRSELDRTIRNKLIADVPLGVFLSGGLDSSTIVAMASRHATGRLKTFSVGFGSEINELPYARMVANRYDTDHTELLIEADIVDAVQKVSAYYDEPFADSSSVPTYLISKAAREYVAVVLTGDGGDELLAGYEGYAHLRGYSDYRWLSKGMRLAEAIGRRISGGSLLERFYPLPGSSGASARWVDSRSTFTSAQVSGFLNGNCGQSNLGRAAYLNLPQTDPMSRAFEFDINYYLPDDLLKKVDMASMANSLETRAPLLDHHLVELFMRMPVLEKVRGGRDKSILREAMEPYLPDEILRREKQGFGAPLSGWLSGPLRDMVSDLQSGGGLISQLLDKENVSLCFNTSMNSLKTDWRSPLRVWTLLMLEQWLRVHKP